MRDCFRYHCWYNQLTRPLVRNAQHAILFAVSVHLLPAAGTRQGGKRGRDCTHGKEDDALRAYILLPLAGAA